MTSSPASRVADRWDPPVSGCEKIKLARAGVCWVLGCYWATAVARAREEEGASWAWPFSNFFLTKTFLPFSKQQT